MEINRAPPPPPYWNQPSHSSAMARRRPPSYPSPVLSPPVLIILLPIITFVFLFFAIPPVLSLTSHIFRPFTVKKSWDSLNIFLVLFAILCGIFARKNDDESGAAATTTTNDEGNINGVVSSAPPNVSDHVGNARTGPIRVSESVSQEWFGFSDRNDSNNSINTIYDQINRTPPGSAALRLRRSSSSYPDLRQESNWNDNRDDQKFQFRFFDDFEIKKYRQTVSFDHRHRSRHRSEAEDGEIKEVPIDTFVVRPSTPPKSPALPPPPPPAPKTHSKSRRTYRAVERREKVENRDENGGDREFAKARSLPPTPPPPPPRPPPSPARIRPEPKKLERRKSNVKREITMAIASLYNQRKRKKKQRIANNNYDSAAQSSPTEQLESRYSKVPPPSPPPPPPPLPPPHSVFHNLFRKGTKSKRIHSVPPPPPPPPRPILSSLTSSTRSSRTKNRSATPPAPPPPPPSEHSRRKTSTFSGRPPLPAKSSSYYDDNMISGCQSPLIPMPPPPPPPFKMPELKFLVHGDYVKIRSNQSSRCGSPEPMDDVDSSSTKEESESVNVINGGDGLGSVFCPSPDVDIKADTFIARLYDGWRLEKINSIKGKRKL
ncbi:formin-like protein 14 [Humulus lupulus]|uniref:formin-like protein 14 n=1 Tax=Humulus lupulus TaxID=3486 RepID=UPI002B40E1CF|nr:formin-like protein 14 [Humulus lupulus]